jgi:mRNA interferase MazF
LDGPDFASGGLELTSYVRPGKIFTANETLMIEKVGQLRADKLRVILRVIAEIFIGRA